MPDAAPIDLAPPLTLASASPRRRELLGALGVPFAVISADIDERIDPGEAPAEAATRLARSKALAVAHRAGRGYVLGADTIVVLDRRILGKPKDAGEATAMLDALRAREHTVITAIALCDAQSGGCSAVASSTSVRMRAYTDAEIAASIAAGTPFDKAGAYAIQDEQFAPVERIDGCYCNVVGLPLWSVYRLLSHSGMSFQPRPPSDTRHVCSACPLQAAVCVP